MYMEKVIRVVASADKSHAMYYSHGKCFSSPYFVYALRPGISTLCAISIGHALCQVHKLLFSRVRGV